MNPTVEIVCTHCGAEAFLKRDPAYEGFKKTGEALSCSAYGGLFSSEQEVPFKLRVAAPRVFTEADYPKKVKVFDEGENLCFCRYCANYVVNPFMQFCSCRKKEVQATDSCPQFSPASGNPQQTVTRL